MEEHLEELESIQKTLRSINPDVHLFCPRISDNDAVDYESPDSEDDGISRAEKAKLINDAEQRQLAAYDFCLVFAASDEELGDWQREHLSRLNDALTKCDRCVKNYHAGRKSYLKRLSERFNEDIVEGMADRINNNDFSRIDEGLVTASNILKEIPENLRTMKALRASPTTVIALYESLCCPPYLTDNVKLAESFDMVFKSIQQNKTLKLHDMLPAMTHFLFSADEKRVRFAQNAWKLYSENLNQALFEWAVEGSLIAAINSVSVQDAPLEEVRRFWQGVSFILDRLDETLITLSLRGMEVQPDIYHLALQHLTLYDSEELLDLVISSLRMLVKKSPTAFWDAYGSISPATVAGLILDNRAFYRLLARPNHSEQVLGSSVPYGLAWIPNFVQSLPPAQQYEPCRLILHKLFERVQQKNSDISEEMRNACLRAGLNALSEMLQIFTTNTYKINASTSFIVISNSLGLVGQYREKIVSQANVKSNLEISQDIAQSALTVIQHALALHCKFLLAEFSALKENHAVHHGMNNEALPIWQTVLDSLDQNRPEMAKKVLMGITALIGLEKFKPTPVEDRDRRRFTPPLSKAMVNFNDDFGQVTDMITGMLERLSDFRPSDIRQLCSSSETAYSLFGALTPSERDMYDAAVEVFKTMTGQSERIEAISDMLKSSLALAMESLAYATGRISTSRTFASLPYVIKTSRDVLNSLCDPQNGILRSLSPSEGEQKAITKWWGRQWHELNIAFGSTESWSSIYDKKDMTDFCRDAMEYAENLFDQFQLLVSILGNQDQEKNQTAVYRQELLEQPRRAMDGMSKWLRLRDEYLLNTVVSLTCKILRRLGSFDMEVNSATLQRIGNVAKSVTVTNLIPQQKSELSRALEEHQGIEVIEKARIAPRKIQSTIEAWSKSAGSENAASDAYRSLTRAADSNKSMIDQMRARQAAKPAVIASKKANEEFVSFKESRDRAKEEKKKRDAENIARARALRQSARVQGEGSGLKGLGVIGKEHVPVRGEIMVSDDESSEEDGEELNSVLSKNREASKNVRDYDASRREQLKQLQQSGPVRKTKIQRSANDMRARLKPPMEPLHAVILSWDIFHNADDPPQAGEYRKVDDVFPDPTSYKETFFPLLISEAWRSLRTATEENTFKPFDIKIANRLTVDRFMEVGTSMPMLENKENNIMEGDIVLFSKGQDPAKDRMDKHCLARVQTIKRKKDILEISYRIKGQGNELITSLSPGGTIRGVKINSMTTIEREYAALGSLMFYDLCEEILSARPSPILPYSDENVKGIKKIYGLNTAQAKAVRSAKDNDAFTLIQGPPGSGKTKTIVAMVGALLTNNLRSGGGIAIAQTNTGLAKPSGPPAKKKLLVCAPSNAAVDELVVRLKAGIKTLDGDFQKINVIRLGRTDAINANVKDVTLDELVKARLDGDGKSGKQVVSEREKLHLDAGRVKGELAALRPKLDEARAKENKDLERRLQKDYDMKKREQARLGAKIDESKDSGNTAARESEILRRKLQQEIIDSAHVLCATLSGSGHDMFTNLSVEFETVIIDEAAQSIELSALIPLKYGCSKCILVGDPKQLPPTVLSRSAASYGYEQSLFVRMQQNHPKDVHLLDTQYRMHPDISVFPSEQFYDSQLIDGPNMDSLRGQEWHNSELLGPYRFFDVKGTQVAGGRGHSFINIEELEVALQLYHRLRTDFKSFDPRGKVGIITPYKAQLRELRRRFQDKYGDNIVEDIDFNTTDAFQGREADIIIFSCVRARPTGGIGFLEDIRRMNVGLTRAKSSLWVLGNSDSLMQGEFWAKLINNAKKRKLHTQGDVLSLLKRPTKMLTNVSSLPPQPKPQPQIGHQNTASKALQTSDKTSANSSRQSSSSDHSRRPSLVDIPMTDAPDLSKPLVKTPSTSSHAEKSETETITSLVPKQIVSEKLKSSAIDKLKRPSKDPSPDGAIDPGVKKAPTAMHIKAPTEVIPNGLTVPRPVAPPRGLIVRKRAAVDPLRRTEKKRPK